MMGVSYMNGNPHNAWDLFCRTGHIEDYLAYRWNEAHNPQAQSKKADNHATDSGGNRPPAIQG